MNKTLPLLFTIPIIYLLVACDPLTSLIGSEEKSIPEIGAYGPLVLDQNVLGNDPLNEITLSFNEDIEFEATIQEGKLIINFNQPLETGRVYTLTVERNVTINPKLTYPFKIRQTCLVYIGNFSTQPAIWKKCDDQDAVQLTITAGRVFDLSVSRNGEWLAYIQQNDSGNHEIWRISRDAEREELLVECRDETCVDAVLDPNGENLAYAVYGSQNRLVVMNIQAGNTYTLQVKPANLQFSPDGKYMSFFDQNDSLLKILNMDSKEIVSFKSAIDLVGSWSNDSRQILFGVNDYWGGLAGVVVFEADISKGTAEQLFGPIENKYMYEYYQPQYTNNTDWLIVTVRDQTAGFGKQIWLIKQDGSEYFKISDDALNNYSSIEGDPSFSQIAFQRYKIGSSDTLPQVGIWNSTDNGFEVVSEDSIQPYWLP